MDSSRTDQRKETPVAQGRKLGEDLRRDGMARDPEEKMCSVCSQSWQLWDLFKWSTSQCLYIQLGQSFMARKKKTRTGAQLFSICEVLFHLPDRLSLRTFNIKCRACLLTGWGQCHEQNG